MFFKKILGQPPKGGIVDKGNGNEEGLRDPVEILKAAFFQISSRIIEKKELDTVLEIIVRESLKCLNAQRATVFLLDEKTGILKTQFAYTSNPLNDQVSLFEEKEVARKVIRQGRSFLLQQPKDFSEFFKYEERERKITSLISIPLYCRTIPARVLSVALINELRTFTEKDLQFLLIFGNQASIAMEIACLTDEIRKGIETQNHYERYLGNILEQLESLSDHEQRRIEEHIEKLLPKQPAQSEKRWATPQIDGAMAVCESLSSNSAWSRNGQQKNREEQMLQMEVENESLSFSEDFPGGGVFIRTPHPMDLGEQPLLKLYIPDGQEPIEVICKVVWTNKYGKETKHLHRGMGVKLMNLSPEMKKRIEKYILVNENKEISPEYWSISVVDAQP